MFVIGAGPMMDGGAQRVTAHAVRTWHVVQVLRGAGHDVSLCTVSQCISPLDPEEHFVDLRNKDGFAYENIDMRMGNMLGYIAERYRAVQPDGVVGVATEPSAWACRMRPTVPVWTDLHGWVMAEAQLKAAYDGSDDILSYFWHQERPVLRRADRISVVSNAQRFAVLGELATLGRLNRHTRREQIVFAIPSSVDPTASAPPPMDNPIAPLVRDEAAFVVLWSGGFNTWTDAATLFEALEWAMARDTTIHFVVTGGSLPGHADAVFDAFRERAEQSPHRDRYHLVGWVPARQFTAYPVHSHLAICVDFPCVETAVGTRTRLVEAMAFGLPVLMTRGTELSRDLEQARAGRIVEPGNPEALGDTLVECARDRVQTAAMGERARQYVERDYAIGRTMAPIVLWAARPCFAADNARKQADSPTLLEAALNPLEAGALALDEVDDVAALVEARRELDRLRSRWPLRVWRWLRRR
jgi:glycosyltransferase involved in cell wall biosynthesis